MQDIQPEDPKYPTKYTCLAAFWTKDHGVGTHEVCYKLLDHYLREEGKQLIQIERLFPDIAWLSYCGDDQEAIALTLSLIHI